jgi:hypothetical protein
MTDDERQLAEWETDGGPAPMEYQDEFEKGDPFGRVQAAADRIIADPVQRTLTSIREGGRPDQAPSYTYAELAANLRAYRTQWQADHNG